MEILRSALDGSGTVVTSFYNSDSDHAVMLNVECASAVKAGSPTITAVTYLTVAVCKRVDASNFCVQLPPPAAPYGKVVEVYADGGSITIFPTSGTFFDGSASVSTTTGARFRTILSTDNAVIAWAKTD